MDAHLVSQRIAVSKVLPDVQSERGDVIQVEHPQSDIPGVWWVGDAHGGGGMLMLAVTRGVDDGGCSR
jgi:hypothetical protein